MKKSILKTCLFFSLFLATVQIGFSTVVIICDGNGDVAVIDVVNDGCSTCVDTYGCAVTASY